MASRQLDECASRLPVGISDCGVSAKLNLRLGLGDDLQKPPLKSVNAVCMLYVQSLHVLSFQLLGVKSDEYSKPGPEINAQTVLLAWFQARLLTAIAEGPKKGRRKRQTLNFKHT